MSKEANINWLEMCIKDREQKLATLKPELKALQRIIPELEAILEKDRDDLKKLKEG